VNPFFFGSSQSQLFGAYDPPPGGGRRGAVLCYPWGREYLLAHGTFRYLARLLAGAGYHVLRFDYSGTGDSAGEFEDAGAEQWVAEIHTAIDELRDVGGVEQVTLIGLRYGAALAALAARARRDVERLVLWDPVADGASYLAGFGVPVGVGLAEPKVECEVQGVVLTPQMRHDIEGVIPECYGADLPRTLLLTTDESADTGSALREHLSAAGVGCTAEHVPDLPIWALEWGGGGIGMPVTAVRAIVAWMS
jgi:pimeloyl-ACP methyl ester carboxylesterase